MQWKHVVVLACQDLVAGLDDQFISGVVQPSARAVGGRGGLLQDRIARDHLTGDQILADAEMLERPLGLRSPQLVRSYLDHAEAVSLLSEIDHALFPCWWSSS